MDAVRERTAQVKAPIGARDRLARFNRLVWHGDHALLQHRVDGELEERHR